jgi:Nucleotidyl transferase AbiEii toxin, Type IV TA system
VIKEALEKQFMLMGVPNDMITVTAADVPLAMPDKDPQTLFAKYRSLYPPNKYLADEVKIEFSVRSLKYSYAMINIQSILWEIFPNEAYQGIPFEVPTTEPKKTLLEKIFLLHEKFLTHDTGNIAGERQSRHLYDLAINAETAVGVAGQRNMEFYKVLLEHRKHYINLRGVNYESMQPSLISFVPPPDLIELFRDDYSIMQREMIYGESPDFNTLLQQLRILNGRFRLIGEGRTLEEIIGRAQSGMDTELSEYPNGSISSIKVNYSADPNKHESLANRFVTYNLHFLREGNQWNFHSLEIVNSFH